MVLTFEKASFFIINLFTFKNVQIKNVKRKPSIFVVVVVKLTPRPSCSKAD